MKMMRTNLYTGLVLAVIGLTGCEHKPKTINADELEAGTNKGAVDPALARAVAAASAHHKVATAPGTQPGAPPPNGIFAPGAADKAMARGAAPKLVVGTQGRSPRVTLQPLQPKPNHKNKGKLTLNLRESRGALPPLELALTIQAKRPKGEKPGSAGPVDVVAGIDSADVSSSERQNVPPAFVDQVSHLKGSRITYSILPDGAGRNFSYDLPKNAKGLDPVLGALVEAFSAMTIPVPHKPVGVGAMWMVTSRGMVADFDVVSYRLVKVKSISGHHVQLSVDAKGYAASDHTERPPGLPASVGKVKLGQFTWTSNGTIDLEQGVPLPTGVKLTQLLQAPVVAVKNPRRPVANTQRVTTVDFTLAQHKKKAH